jgi:DNA-binding GntR family transcriptional regulator
LSGNGYLTETLERLMAPLFAFVVLASEVPVTATMAHEHYALIDALANLDNPESTDVVRKSLETFSQRWVSSMSPRDAAEATAT